MHTKEMSEYDGVFHSGSEKYYNCPKCKQQTVKCHIWESNCGGYEDFKYECQNVNCKHYWWVDGPDA